MFARRALHWRIQQRDVSAAPKTSGKLNVLHQRYRSESTDPRKMIASDKDTLIAVNGSEGAAMPAFKSLQSAQTRVTAVKLSIERASACSIKTVRERLQVRIGQKRVDVMKEKDFAGSQLRCPVHLLSTTRCRNRAFLDLRMVRAGLAAMLRFGLDRSND